jgi:hypothetical protein
MVPSFRQHTPFGVSDYNYRSITCATWRFYAHNCYTHILLTIALLDASRHVALDINVENTEHLIMYCELNAKKKDMKIGYKSFASAEQLK